MSRRHVVRVLITMVLAVGCLPGCGELTKGFVYVDNGSNEPITVEVDGVKKGGVAPGAVLKLKLDLGEHRFVVKSNNSIVYDQLHLLDYGDHPYRYPQYVLNPDHTHCYCEVTVKYGEDWMADQRVEELMEMLREVEDQRRQMPPAEFASWEADLSRRVQREFREITFDLEPIQADGPFVEFETPNNILTPVPTHARVKYSDCTERSALIRIPRQVRDEIVAALQVKTPSLGDLHRLAAAEAQAHQFIRYQQ